MKTPELSRRRFLQGTGALIVSFRLFPRGANVFAQTAAVSGDNDPQALDSWLAIAPDGTVTFYTSKVEIGTGTITALAQIVAEELDVPFERVKMASGDTANTIEQGSTVGSRTIERAGPQIQGRDRHRHDHRAGADRRRGARRAVRARENGLRRHGEYDRAGLHGRKPHDRARRPADPPGERRGAPRAFEARRRAIEGAGREARRPRRYRYGCRRFGEESRLRRVDRRQALRREDFRLRHRLGHESRAGRQGERPEGLQSRRPAAEAFRRAEKAGRRRSLYSRPAPPRHAARPRRPPAGRQQRAGENRRKRGARYLRLRQSRARGKFRRRGRQNRMGRDQGRRSAQGRMDAAKNQIAGESRRALRVSKK